jgi:transposase
MLQSGARWRDCPSEYGPYTTIYNRFNRWAKPGRWRAIFEALAKLGKDAVALSLDSTSVKARSALPAGRPSADPGPRCRHCRGARCPGVRATHVDAHKGYDGDGLRAEIIEHGATPVIPNKSNRVVIHPFNKRAYKGRNAIERCFCRLKDFRRIATRYDKLARNFLASVHLAALWHTGSIESGP